jgi:hypothetical protein
VIPGSLSAEAFGGHTPCCDVDAFFTGAPLLHTSLFPLLMQVYFMPLTVVVTLCLLHLAPALTAAAFAGAVPNNETVIRTANILRMSKY